MTRWSVGINNYYFTSMIILEEAPWYIFALENIIESICSNIPQIPLPKIKIIRDNETTNLKDYYGTFRDIFHSYICYNVTCFCYDRISSKFVYLPYTWLKNEFPKYFENGSDFTKSEDLKEIENNLKKANDVNYEFVKVYNKLKDLVI